jgi:hypothetical protein
MSSCQFPDEPSRTNRRGLPVYVCAVCNKATTNRNTRSQCKVAPPKFTCTHRGEPFAILDDCGCGGTGRNVPVYRCALHGLCTLHASGQRAKWREIAEKRPRGCAACGDRTATELPP